MHSPVKDRPQISTLGVSIYPGEHLVSARDGNLKLDMNDGLKLFGSSFPFKQEATLVWHLALGSY